MTAGRENEDVSYAHSELDGETLANRVFLAVFSPLGDDRHEVDRNFFGVIFWIGS